MPSSKESRIYGVALDFSKAFDNVPVVITLDLLGQARAGQQDLGPASFMYNNPKRYFKN